MSTECDKVAVSSDEYRHLVEVLLNLLRRRGIEPVYFGPGKGEEVKDWPLVTKDAIDHVLKGDASEAIVMCWTGTGCSIVANKMPGIRAALCVDAETAKGARIWNHANVLAISHRVTSAARLEEILNAWFNTPKSTDEWNITQIDRVNELDKIRPAEPSDSRRDP